jgi:plasmid maintenance system killer protein
VQGVASSNLVGPTILKTLVKVCALSGNREGQHSIRINDQWRICFRWHEENAYEVEITDYH